MNTSQPASQISATTASTSSPAVRAPRIPISSAIHTIALIVFLAGWAYVGLLHTSSMRGQASPNRLLLYLPTMVMEWSVFAYIAWGVRKRGISLRELIGPRWSSAKQFFIDFGIAIIFQIGALLVLTCLTLLVHANEDPSRVMYMMPRGATELVMWVLLSMTAGICEETIFRGYFQRQFIGWTGNTVVGVVISAALFGAIHVYQGGKQTIIIGALGAMLSGLAVYRRSLKPGMIAHALQDGITGIVLGLTRR